MRKFNTVFKEKQAVSEQFLEEKLLNEFKKVYSALLEQYEIAEFYSLDEDTQVAFLRELNEYWTEEEGLSPKGEKFLTTKSAILTESSTPLQKKSYLKNKATAVIAEVLRQSDIKTKLYSVLDEMYKNTNSSEISDVLPADAISGTILESFGTALQDLMTEIVYELTPTEELNEREFSEKKRKELAKEGEAMKDGSFPIANVQDLKNAIKAHGRAKNPAAAKAHIKKRAKALGKSDLIPAEWK
jgi:hypothetical protein